MKRLTKILKKSLLMRCNPQKPTHTHTHTCSLLLSFLSTLFVLSAQSFATTPDISADTTTVSCNDSAINTNNAPANLEINWEANTINLHWYNGNTELTVPSESQSCVYDGALIPPPPPAREGYTFRGWRVRGVPDGYTRLEYLGFNSPNGYGADSGTYINTGITLSNNYKLKVRLNGQNFKGVMGRYRHGDASQSFQIFNKAFRFGSNNLSTDLSEYFNTDVILAYGQDGLYVNDIRIRTPSAVTFSTTGACLIGSVGTTDSKFAGKIYEAWIYYQGTPVGHYIPAKRNSDNVLGMYDIIGRRFFVNAGSGTFTTGSNAQ